MYPKKSVAILQDKVIERKLATVLTAGTLVYSSVLTDDMATYCLAIKVRPPPPGGVNGGRGRRHTILTDAPARPPARARPQESVDPSNPVAPYTFAAVVLDAAAGEFALSLLHDDAARTQLETLLVQRRPRELVFEQVVAPRT